MVPAHRAFCYCPVPTSRLILVAALGSVQISWDLPPSVPYAFPSTYGKTDLQHSPQHLGHRECWGFHVGGTLHETWVNPHYSVEAHPWACHAQPYG